MRYDVTMQRPDKLKVVMPGDGPASDFYHDGKVRMAFAPAENLIAVADAPATIEAALKTAYDTAAIYAVREAPGRLVQTPDYHGDALISTGSTQASNCTIPLKRPSR